MNARKTSAMKARTISVFKDDIQMMKKIIDIDIVAEIDRRAQARNCFIQRTFDKRHYSVVQHQRHCLEWN